jgi:hypothetical protein
VSRRVRVGPRVDGNVGLFIAPPGGDAATLPDANLVLNVTSKVSQLLLLGRVSVSGSVVPLGLSRSPFVFLTSQFTFTGVAGPGPIRPSPPFVVGAQGASASINGNGASMTVNLASTTLAGQLQTIYQVFSQAFT